MDTPRMAYFCAQKYTIRISRLKTITAAVSNPDEQPLPDARPKKTLPSIVQDASQSRYGKAA